MGLLVCLFVRTVGTVLAQETESFGTWDYLFVCLFEQLEPYWLKKQCHLVRGITCLFVCSNSWNRTGSRNSVIWYVGLLVCLFVRTVGTVLAQETESFGTWDYLFVCSIFFIVCSCDILSDYH